MRWIDQTAFGDEGNCVQASIASLLGKALDEVPNFIKFHPGGTAESVCDFWDAVEEYIEDQGYLFMTIPVGEKAGRPDILYLASGKSIRGYSHMVVMKGFDMIHDPHPSRSGLVKVDMAWMLVPADPSLLTLRKETPALPKTPEEERADVRRLLDSEM